MTCICSMTYQRSLCIRLVQRAAAKVLLTVRDNEPIPAGTQDLWKVGQFDRLDLDALSPDETATLLSDTLGGSLESDTARRLWGLTRGNVLYLRHIVEQEVADGRLEKQQGHWHWIGEPSMPCGLVELVESRIGALPNAVGAVIDALAIGEPIELAALQRITDPDAVEEADIRGLISLDQVDARVEVRLGASALRRGAKEARGAHEAAAAARTCRHRTGRCRGPRRHAGRDSPRDLEPRLRPQARCRPDHQRCPRRDLAGRSALADRLAQAGSAAPAVDRKPSSSVRMRCRGSVEAKKPKRCSPRFRTSD